MKPNFTDSEIKPGKSCEDLILSSALMNALPLFLFGAGALLTEILYLGRCLNIAA